MTDFCSIDKTTSVLIFGAGQSGLSAFRNLASSHNIAGFIDNDINKQGTQIQGLPVYSVGQLDNLEFEMIFVASEYIESIQSQLLDECGIAPEKVTVLPSHMTRPIQFGVSHNSEIAAHSVLKWLCRLFNAADIHYFLDAGTLLGVVRDSALIPWDDDLDIGLPLAHLDRTKRQLEEHLLQLETLTGYPWQLSEIISDKTFGVIAPGHIRSLKLSCAQPDSGLPMVDLFVKYPNGDNFDYTLASRGISMPLEHILATQWTEFLGVKMKLPAKPELYLERYYGDWKTPQKNWDVAMIKSAMAF